MTNVSRNITMDQFDIVDKKELNSLEFLFEIKIHISKRLKGVVRLDRFRFDHL
jgi:hypothetical protein